MDANTNRLLVLLQRRLKGYKIRRGKKKKKATDLEKERDDESDFLMGSSFNVVAVLTSKIAQSLRRG